MKSFFKTLFVTFLISAFFVGGVFAQSPQSKQDKKMQPKGMEMQGRMKVGDKSTQMKSVMEECTNIVKDMHGGDPAHMKKMMKSGMMTTVMAMYETAQKMQTMMNGIEKMKEDKELTSNPELKKHLDNMEKSMETMMKSMQNMLDNIKPLEAKTRE